MDVNCIYCDQTGGLRQIHRHLVDEHLDKVTTQRDEKTNEMQYDLECQDCDEVITRRVKPRSQNSKFLEEFKAEIAIVAYDRLIFHLVEEHPTALGIDPVVLDQLIEE